MLPVHDKAGDVVAEVEFCTPAKDAIDDLGVCLLPPPTMLMDAVARNEARS